MTNQSEKRVIADTMGWLHMKGRTSPIDKGRRGAVADHPILGGTRRAGGVKNVG